MPEIGLGEPAEITLEESRACLEALENELESGGPSVIAAEFPDCLAAWAALGERALEDGELVQAYAYFRVGYHRGLDRLRKAGWRGTGKVLWAHEQNRGFLRSLKGLGEAAEAIHEDDEARRCNDFLAELAPDFPH